MNTDKTLRETFASHSDKYPMWYYKKLIEIDVDDVIFNLLKETFVVELDDKKIVITFGKNRKHEIGSTQSCNEGLDYTSFETIRKAFREGKWFRISEEDTSDSFKECYELKEKEREKKSMRADRIDLLTKTLNRIKESSNLNLKNIDSNIAEINNMSDEELELVTNQLFEGLSSKS